MTLFLWRYNRKFKNLDERLAQYKLDHLELVQDPSGEYVGVREV